MRRLALFLAIALGVSLAATAGAPAKSEGSDARGVCNAKGVDIYFWPQGHPAIPAIGFPPFAPAHVEFYKPHDVSNAGGLAYMDVVQSGFSTAQCTAAADTAMTFASSSPQSTTSTQKLRCTFAANVDIRFGPFNKVTRRYVTRIVRIHGKKKKVRRAIKQTVRVGNMASIGFAGASGALAEVRLSAAADTSSSLKWDTRSCAPVDVAG